ncbi:efflux RND transporter periplasmic adaptor subunit [Pedobacter immunditicola]|uniref:efflux RND transporter periplasmic adaptor subunit n=1 Tax=Pedobacter immunditicola TaxID=3133440 RepID=UPI0030A60FB1
MQTPDYCLLGLFLTLWSCAERMERTSPVIKPITESVYASGIIKSAGQYQVFSTVSGLVQEIYVQDGDTVVKDSPILKLSAQTAELNQQSARLDRQYNLEKAMGESLRDLEIQIALAKSKMENDALLLERQKDMWKNSVGSLNDLEQRELTSKNSTTTYNSLLLRYKDLKKQLKYNLDRSLKNLEITSAVANEYLIKSKINGRVYDLLKEPGELVTPQTLIAIIGDAHDFFAELQVDENDITRIKLGQEVLITMDSYKGSIFKATVYKIDPLMSETSRSFTVEAMFVLQPAVLYPNLTAEANIVIQTKKKALTIPRDFLIDDKYVLMQNYKMKEVVCGLKDFQEVEVLSGLKADDVILKPAE